MESFDEWKEEQERIHNDYDAENAWYAGQQSKQDEVDELRKNLNNALKTIEIQQRFLDDADGANKILTSQASELQKKYDAMYNAFVVADDCRKEWHRCYVGIRQREDELQKRIDEVIYDLQHIESAMWEEQVEHVLMILKGDQS